MDSDIYISSTVRTGLIFKSIVQLLTICIQQLNAHQNCIKLTPRSKHHHSEKWHKMQIWCENISWCKNIYCLFAISGVSHPYMHLVVFVYNLKETILSQTNNRFGRFINYNYVDRNEKSVHTS